ncbi:MAG: hypothetical protein ACRC0J_16865 [Shewanella oncorhynchi]
MQFTDGNQISAEVISLLFKLNERDFNCITSNSADSLNAAQLDKQIPIKEKLMKLITTTFSIVIALFSSSIYAKCQVGSETIFSCMTAKGKKIEVCDAEKTISYSFGKLHDKPEIVVNVPRNQASTYQWNGVGRYMSYSVNIPNGNTVYSVFWSFDRLSEDDEIKAGVNVETNSKSVATVKCSGKNIEQNIEGITLKPTE